MARKSRVTLVNPARLMLVNPGGRTVRRKTNRKRTTTARRSNPFHGYRRRPRRNPDTLRGLLNKAFFATIGASLTNVIVGWIPMALSPLMLVGAKFGVGYAIGWVGENVFKLGTERSESLAIGGAAVAAGDMIQILFPQIQRAFVKQVPPQTDAKGNKTMGNIVTVPPHLVGFNQKMGLGNIVSVPVGALRRAA